MATCCGLPSRRRLKPGPGEPPASTSSMRWVGPATRPSTARRATGSWRRPSSSSLGAPTPRSRMRPDRLHERCSNGWRRANGPVLEGGTRQEKPEGFVTGLGSLNRGGQHEWRVGCLSERGWWHSPGRTGASTCPGAGGRARCRGAGRDVGDRRTGDARPVLCDVSQRTHSHCRSDTGHDGPLPRGRGRRRVGACHTPAAGQRDATQRPAQTGRGNIPSVCLLARRRARPARGLRSQTPADPPFTA